VAFEPNRVGRFLYSGTALQSLCRLRSRLGYLAAIGALALTASGCSYQLGSLSEKKGEDANASVTGSIAETRKTSAKDDAPTAGDLAYARAAAAEVLKRGGQGASQPWENPETGARGTVTPIATAYNQDGFTCQDFLASYVRDGSSEDWMRGEACRLHRGNWEVRNLRPWKTS
jgi:surface antigen